MVMVVCARGWGVVEIKSAKTLEHIKEAATLRGYTTPKTYIILQHEIGQG